MAIASLKINHYLIYQIYKHWQLTPNLPMISVIGMVQIAMSMVYIFWTVYCMLHIHVPVLKLFRLNHIIVYLL